MKIYLSFFRSFELKNLFVIAVFFLGSMTSFAQGPGSLFVDAGPDVTIDCSNGSGCTDLTANFLETFETISETYTVEGIPYNPPFPFDGLANSLNPNIDDAWSPVDNLPYDFCFFGNVETEFQVGSNGVIRFDVDPGDTTNGWSFTENLPNNTNPTLAEANVFTPGHDIDPSVSTTEEIAYEVLGTFPNRVLVVSYFEVPMFSGACNNLLATQMVVFYEFSNVIEIYIQDKPSCPSWNSGNAVIGIQNNDGDIAYVPPGRNTSDSPWTATNEAWRFTPDGAPTYVFEWLDASGTVIGTDPTIEVCPTEVSVYTARVTYSNCNGDVVVLEDEVEVTPAPGSFSVDLGGDQVFCDTPSYDITAALDGADPADATFLWNTSETTQTITVSATGTYSVDVTVAGCTVTESVEITFLTSPDCNIEPVCESVDFEENFGTGTGRVCDLNGASTTYICNDLSQIEDGEYTISNTSTGLNTGWHVGMEDHTEGDVDGRMLFVNADFNPGEFYRRTITLNPDGDYFFSAWITTVYDTDTNICGGTSIPSNVIFRIEDTSGNLIEETNTGDIPNGPDPNWQEYLINFNTGANSDIQLVLINNSIGGCGNDLAIDDITLSLQNSQPQIVTPDDMFSCDQSGGTGSATFDLESQIPTILDGQDPAQFNITFHLSQLNAEANIGAIDTPSAYENTENPETIYVRVEKASEPTCYSTVEFDLLVGETVDLQIDLSESFEICQGEDFPELNATPQNPDVDLTIVTYEWVDGDGAIVSTDAVFTPTSAGTYTVTVTFPPCNEETLSTTITVTEPPVLDLGQDVVLCEGESFEIIPEITGNTDGISYLWSTGETSETIVVDASGTYNLEITVGSCVVTDSINIEINENPIVTIGEDFKTCPDETNVLTASSDQSDVTYQWYLNGEILTGETNSTLEFSIPSNTVGGQIYTVEVAAGSCVSSADITVQLYDVDNCTISEGLSPNGDGLNDCLDLEFLSDRTDGFSLEMFNRYGMSVYQNSDYINEFCGIDQDGNELPTGTYFYVLKFNTPDAIYGEVKTGWIYINKAEN